MSDFNLTWQGFLGIVGFLTFIGVLMRGLKWLADEVRSIAQDVSEKSATGLREVLTETATDLRQGIEGIRAEIGGIREDLHLVGDHTKQNTDDLKVLARQVFQHDTQLNNIAKRPAARKRLRG